MGFIFSKKDISKSSFRIGFIITFKILLNRVNLVFYDTQMPIDFLSFNRIAKCKLGFGVPFIELNFSANAALSSSPIVGYAQINVSFAKFIGLAFFNLKQKRKRM
jgi:hypothetical protein